MKKLRKTNHLINFFNKFDLQSSCTQSELAIRLLIVNSYRNRKQTWVKKLQ